MGGIYHIYNRGVEKRVIFQEDSDYLRFIHDLFEFNDKEPVLNILYRFNKQYKQYMEVQPPYIIEREKRSRKLIVKLLVFCLMPNHFHLLLQPVVNGGISNFMQKLATGYTMYFNKKYERVGALFQSRYKRIKIVKESHFIHLPYYIHCNPLDLKFPQWRYYGGSTSIDWKKAIEFLENYRWSSHLDYLGRKNFPSVTQREFLTEFFSGPEQYKKDLTNWLKERSFEDIKHLILE